MRIWAGAVLYLIGSVNFLFDMTQRPHLTASELCRVAGVSQATASNKAREIQKLLRIGPYDQELSRREVLETSPLRRMVEINGLIVPADMLDALLGDDEGEGAILGEIEQADRDAVELLRKVLPSSVWMPPPADMRTSAAALRRNFRLRKPALRPVLRANGWSSSSLPPDDRQLWLETAGARSSG